MTPLGGNQLRVNSFLAICVCDSQTQMRYGNVPFIRTMAFQKRRNIQAGITTVLVTLYIGVVILLIHHSSYDASQGGVRKVSLPLTAVQHYGNEDNNDVRLFDCFLINIELDMLEFHLKTLDAVFDVFVLAESKVWCKPGWPKNS